MGGQAVLGDHAVAAGHQLLVGGVQLLVGLGGQHLEQRRLRGGHHERVAVERALLADAAVGDERGQLVGHADRAAREAAADRLGQADDVRRDAEQLGRAARGHGRAGLDLVEDQLRRRARA